MGSLSVVVGHDHQAGPREPLLRPYWGLPVGPCCLGLDPARCMGARLEVGEQRSAGWANASALIAKAIGSTHVVGDKTSWRSMSRSCEQT
jgi:hypothetical protein